MENEYLILNAGKAGDVITIAGVSVTSEGKDVKVMAASIANTLNANVDFTKSYTASAKEGSVDITKNDNVTADPGVAAYTGDAAVVSGTVDGDVFTVTSELADDELASIKGAADEQIEEITSEAKNLKTVANLLFWKIWKNRIISWSKKLFTGSKTAAAVAYVCIAVIVLYKLIFD